MEGGHLLLKNVKGSVDLQTYLKVTAEAESPRELKGVKNSADYLQLSKFSVSALKGRKRMNE